MHTEFGFVLKGVSPHIWHADNIEQADELDAWRKAPANKGKGKKGDDRSPPWTYQTYISHDGEHMAVPSDNLMSALRSAAAKIAMKGMTSFKSMSQSGLLIHQEFCEFSGPMGRVPIARLAAYRDADFTTHSRKAAESGFSLFMKRVTLKGSKNIRVRPRFDDWTVRGTVEIIDDTITPEILQQMFDLAGRYSGLGDWRPSAKIAPGPYGRFTAELTPLR